MAFDFMPVLTDGRFVARPLEEADRAGLTCAAADPLIWAGHPVKDRYKPEVFAGYFDFLRASEGTMVFAERSGGRIIGCSRFYVSPDAPDAVSIGFTFLVRDHWGGATNRALKALMLEHIFGHCDEAWFHIDPTNIRSQKATLKIGARYVGDAEMDLGVGAANWRRYRLRKEDWRGAGG